MIQKIWKKISPWFDRQYYLVTTYTIVTSLAVLYFYISKPTLQSEHDLISLKGTYLKHSFTHTSGRGGGYRYYLWLNNYSNSFKIKADFINESLKPLFNSTIKPGTELTLQIAKSERSKLNSEDYIFIYSLASNDFNYLNSKDTLQKHNSPLMLILSMCFTLFGILYYIFRKRYLHKNYS